MGVELDMDKGADVQDTAVNKWDVDKEVGGVKEPESTSRSLEDPLLLLAHAPPHHSPSSAPSARLPFGVGERNHS